MKKIISTFLVLSLLISIIPAALATDTPGVQPYQDTACGYGNGIHDMKQNGSGTVYLLKADGSAVYAFDGPAFQCKNGSGRCNYVIVTEYNPIYDHKIGQYACYQADGQIALQTYLRVDSIGQWGKTPMDGYSFRDV